MDQKWFEMQEVRRRFFDKAVWIPLRAAHKIESIGEYGHLGYKEEFFGAGSLAIPDNMKRADTKCDIIITPEIKIN